MSIMDYEHVDHWQAMGAMVVNHGARGTVHLLSAPGQGKDGMAVTVTEAFREQCADWDEYRNFGHSDVRASQHEAIDVKGLFDDGIAKNHPFLVDGTPYTTTKRFAMYPEKGVGMLNWSEYFMGAKDIRKAIMQSLAERRIGEHKLADGYSQICSDNMSRHKGLGDKATPAEANRRCWLYLDDGCVAEMRGEHSDGGRCAVSFIQLARQDFKLYPDDIPIDLTKIPDWKCPDGIHPSIANWLAQRPSLINTLDVDRIKQEDYAYSSNRTWERFSKVFLTCQYLGQECYDFVFKPMAHGLVGPGPAEEFIQTLKLLEQQLDYDAIKADGDNADLPEDGNYRMGILFMAIGGLSSAIHFNHKTAPEIFKWVGRTTQFSPELPMVFAKTLESSAQKNKAVEKVICDTNSGYVEFKANHCKVNTFQQAA